MPSRRPRLLLEDADERLADAQALLLRVGHAGQLGQEAVLRLDVHERHVEVLAEGLDHLVRLALAQEPVVDEDAGQLVADGAVDEQRGDRRVDAAGEAAHHALVADLAADALDLLLDDRQRRPRGRGVAGPEEEVLQQVRAARACARTSGWNCTAYSPRSGASMAATGVAEVEAVTVNPAGARVTESLWLIQQVVTSGRSWKSSPPTSSRAVLPNSARPVRATSPPSAGRHGLHAVADAQHRDPELEHARVEARRAGLVDGRRAAGEDQPLRVASAQLLERRVVRQELGVHAALAHAPGDELGVLRPEVEHDHRPLRGTLGAERRCRRGGGHQWAIPTPCSRCSRLPSVCRAGANMISAFWKSWMVS